MRGAGEKGLHAAPEAQEHAASQAARRGGRRPPRRRRGRGASTTRSSGASASSRSASFSAASSTSAGTAAMSAARSSTASTRCRRRLLGAAGRARRGRRPDGRAERTRRRPARSGMGLGVLDRRPDDHARPRPGRLSRPGARRGGRVAIGATGSTILGALLLLVGALLLSGASLGAILRRSHHRVRTVATAARARRSQREPRRQLGRAGAHAGHRRGAREALEEAVLDAEEAYPDVVGDEPAPCRMRRHRCSAASPQPLVAPARAARRGPADALRRH